MPNFQPTIDIVIAALNEAQSIGKCIQSLKCQDYPAELVTLYVVVDSQTTDDTANIAASYGAIVILSEGAGVALVRNLGFSQGSGELVGFVDAHCILKDGWITAMVAQFEDPMVGGCQGLLESVCDSPLIQRFLSQSLFSSDQRLIEHTVEARFSPYPWLVGGNSVFRRRAVDDAGPLTECPSDDADRSWRVFLEGYQLVLAASARSMHEDHATILSYLRKHFRFGVGAAQLAYSYGFSGRRTQSDTRYPRTFEVLLIDLIYSIGYLSEQLRQRSGIIALPKRNHQPVQRRFRPRFTWSAEHVLQISPHVVYWRIGGDRAVCVHLLNDTRMEFDGVANLIFRQLIVASNRDEMCSRIAEQYETEVGLVQADVDDFIETLRQEGLVNLLVKCENTSNQAQTAVTL